MAPGQPDPILRVIALRRANSRRPLYERRAKEAGMTFDELVDAYALALEEDRGGEGPHTNLPLTEKERMALSVLPVVGEIGIPEAGRRLIQEGLFEDNGRPPSSRFAHFYHNLAKKGLITMEAHGREYRLRRIKGVGPE